MAPSQGNPDAVNKTQEPRQTCGSDTIVSHQARPKCVGVGGAEVEWRARRPPAVNASFLVHTSRHCTASSGTMSTRHCTKKGTKKHGGSIWSREKGPHRLHIPSGSQTSGW
ncbi:hypothetical protein TcCL_NonESM10626 [Trypanosoma cruzi]|nr:hypothetical protein TcCL_NonESM10626 [Trypanosoma cruzi]